MFHHSRSTRLRHEPLEERRLLDGSGGQIEFETLGEQNAPASSQLIARGAAIFGQVHADANRNGIFEPRELSLNGVKITLEGKDISGDLVSRETTTRSDGNFGFLSLEPGTYSIIQEQPAGYTNGTQTVGEFGGIASMNRIDNIIIESEEFGSGYLFSEFGTPNLREPSSGFFSPLVGTFDPEASFFDLEEESFEIFPGPRFPVPEPPEPSDSTTRFYVPQFQFGKAGSQAVVGNWNDFGGDTIGVFDPESGLFRLKNSNGNPTPIGVVNDSITPFVFGGPGFVALAGDWNWDGVDTVGVYDPETSNFFLRDSNDSGVADAGQFTFGRPGWVPLTGDWDGDGFDGIGMYDPETATFYLSNTLSAGAPDIEPFQYGLPGWKPIAGDWNDNGIVTIGVYNPDTASFFLRNSNTTGVADIEPFNFGSPGLDPIIGDWDFSSGVVLFASSSAPTPGVRAIVAANVSAPLVFSDLLVPDESDDIAPPTTEDNSIELADPAITQQSLSTFGGAFFTSATESDAIGEILFVDIDGPGDGLIEQLAVDQLS